MPQLINLGSELLRINPEKNVIEYSHNDGRAWIVRYISQQCGEFRDLLEYKGELLACTGKGLYYSKTGGRSWVPRCISTSSYGDFLNLQADDDILLANTTKGLYYSRNSGRGWVKR